MANSGEMMLTFNGNMYIEHPVSVYCDEGFLKLVELQKTADVAFGGLECSIVDGNEWPAYGSGMGYAGSFLGAPPMMVDELKFLGINAVYAANNHSCDFGELGVLSTVKHLRAGGIDFAGIGASFSEASEICYISTPHGRVALLAVADWGPRQQMDLPSPWPFGYLGSDEGPWYRSRPGVDLFRYEAAIHVDQEFFEQLRRASEAMGWESIKKARSLGGGQSSQPRHAPANMGWEQDSETEFYFMGRKFVLDESFGFSTFPFQEDADYLCKRIREAQRSADVVVVALHDQIHGDFVHDYIRTVSRVALDAGADIFVCTAGATKGVGIELYNGKPIIHMVYPYCFQNSQVRHVPRSVLQRRGLDPDSTATDLYVARSAGSARAATETGVSPFPSRVGGVVYAVILDGNLELKEVRAYPTEELRGSRHRLPILLESGSKGFDDVLSRELEYCDAIGTPFETHINYGVIPLS